MSSSFSSKRWVIIKKQQVCSGCLVRCEPGTRMNKIAGVFEGDFFSGYLCSPCDDFLGDNPECFRDGWAEGDIGEERRQEEVDRD